jgi:ubiquinone/menaquinone biosynthesis C-methylase UbiE
MRNSVARIQAAYDLIASDYDTQWSVHVQEPQRRLTRELQLARGQRCADLGCGTGVDTLDMSRLVAPAEVVAVDCSPAMLDSAQQRARAAGLTLATHCQSADDFISASADASFDVVSLRFCLGYLDWRAALPRLPRLLRAGGRIGILTILASSAPQAQSIYRQMAADFGAQEVALTALSSPEQIEELLRAGGATVTSSWTHSFRLTFSSGVELAAWLPTSGIATSPAFSELSEELTTALWADFAQRIEALREREGVPLDFSLAGMVARG